jgi:hypothetical protein
MFKVYLILTASMRWKKTLLEKDHNEINVVIWYEILSYLFLLMRIKKLNV